MNPYRQGKPAAADAFKLSSNENPFEPLPAVLEAIAHGAINRYPDASASALRVILAERTIGDETEWVTAVANKDERPLREWSWGHYFTVLDDADDDFIARVQKSRAGSRG